MGTNHLAAVYNMWNQYKNVSKLTVIITECLTVFTTYSSAESHCAVAVDTVVILAVVCCCIHE
jgi:heme O synthase-like polyprenyltransferase